MDIELVFNVHGQAGRSDKGTVAKILVIGDVATGKTSMIQRYVNKTFDPNHNATLGVDFALKRVRVEENLLNVQLWDIAGQERFIGLAPTYYKHAVAAIVVFDITKRDTLENAKKWKADVDDKVFLRNGDNIPVVLFANKVKLQSAFILLFGCYLELIWSGDLTAKSHWEYTVGFGGRKRSESYSE